MRRKEPHQRSATVRMFSLLLPYKKLLVLSGTAMVLSAAFYVLYPLLFGKAVNSIQQGDKTTVVIFGLIVIVVGVLGAITQGFSDYWYGILASTLSSRCVTPSSTRSSISTPSRSRSGRLLTCCRAFWWRQDRSRTSCQYSFPTCSATPSSWRLVRSPSSSSTQCWRAWPCGRFRLSRGCRTAMRRLNNRSWSSNSALKRTLPCTSRNQSMDRR